METPTLALDCWRPTGAPEAPAYRMANGLVEAWVCPAYGGRLVALQDLRTGTGLLPAGGFGLAGVRPGLAATREGEAASGFAGVFVRLSIPGSPVLVTVCWALPEGAAELLVQCKATNPTGLPLPYDPVWESPGAWKLAPAGPDPVLLGEGGALALGGAVEAEATDQTTRLRCGLGGASWLAPWGCRTDTFWLRPCGGLDATDGAGGGIVAQVAGLRLSLQASLPGTYLVRTATSDGAHFEAEAELGGGPPWSAEAPGEPVTVEVLSGGQSLLEWRRHEPAPPRRLPARSAALESWADPPPGTAEHAYLRGDDVAGVPGLDGPAAARAAARVGPSEPGWARTWAEAARRLPENEAVWRAWAHALRASGEDYAGAAASAHFLSPADPVLRAEAFLGTPVAPGNEPSPLVLPLAEAEEALLEALDALVSLGSLADASRLAEEALRVRDIPTARWILAWCYLAGTRMEAEAAAIARQAASVPPEGRTPWRDVELRALEEVAARFPGLPGAQPWLEAAAAGRRMRTE